MKRQRTKPKKKSRKWPLIILAVVIVAIIAAVSSNDGKNGEASRPASNDGRGASIEQPGHGLTYTVLDEGILDGPAKTMVELHILPAGQLSAQSLESLLRELFTETAKRTGFRYSRHPTQIFIYAYSDRERWAAESALWMAMLSWLEDDTDPKVLVNESRIQAATAGPEVIFGLTEDQRRSIYREAVLAEDRAAKEAEARCPLQPGMTPEVGRGQLERQSEYMAELRDQYVAELLEEHGLTEVQLRHIEVEALDEGWPLPSLGE